MFLLIFFSKIFLAIFLTIFLTIIFDNFFNNFCWTIFLTNHWQHRHRRMIIESYLGRIFGLCSNISSHRLGMNKEN